MTSDKIYQIELEIVKSGGITSISYMQRKYQISFQEAKTIMEMVNATCTSV